MLWSYSQWEVGSSFAISDIIILQIQVFVNVAKILCHENLELYGNLQFK